MKRKSLLLLLVIAAVVFVLFKDKKGPLQPIVIFYDNDVHCSIDGYPKIAGLKNSMPDTVYTAVVSSGDYLQGGTAGALSLGGYILDLQKAVGYDAVTLGNHEFDYFSDRLMELINQYQPPVTCANLYDLKTGKACLPPYIIKEYGPRKVAYVGIVTPETAEAEYYALYNEDGTPIYDLCEDKLNEIVQNAVDAARKAGADYVILLSHMGEDPGPGFGESHSIVAATNGIDVVLDGHTHSVIPADYVNNKDGKPVLITQTGTAFKNIGKLVIAKDGTITSELIPTEEVTVVDSTVQACLNEINAKMDAIAAKVLGESEVDLRINDYNGTRIVRRGETNTGDLLCDAFRSLMKTNIAMSNGGGIRTDIPAGTITYGDITAIYPFINFVYKVEVTGDDILAVLDKCTAKAPEGEEGDFPQCSGLKYTIHTGDRSLSDVEVLNDEGKWEPLVPEKTYQVATINYCVNGGGFAKLWQNCKILEKTDIFYRDAVVKYITDVLGGHIGKEYAEPQGRIRFVK